MSLWRELEDLQKKKAELEFQLHSVEEKEKLLEERARVLEEKLSIQKLESHLKIKTESVQKLEAKVTDLEKSLGETEHRSETYVANEMDSKQERSDFSLRKLFDRE